MGFTSISHFKNVNFESANTLSKCESKATLPYSLSLATAQQNKQVSYGFSVLVALNKDSIPGKKRRIFYEMLSTMENAHRVNNDDFLHRFSGDFLHSKVNGMKCELEW